VAAEHAAGPTQNPTDNAARNGPAPIPRIQTIPPGRHPLLPLPLRRRVGGKTIYYSNREQKRENETQHARNQKNNKNKKHIRHSSSSL
jgi:hypothetical protein